MDDIPAQVVSPEKTVTVVVKDQKGYRATFTRDMISGLWCHICSIGQCYRLFEDPVHAAILTKQSQHQQLLTNFFKVMSLQLPHAKCQFKRANDKQYQRLLKSLQTGHKLKLEFTPGSSAIEVVVADFSANNELLVIGPLMTSVLSDQQRKLLAQLKEY